METGETGEVPASRLVMINKQSQESNSDNLQGFPGGPVVRTLSFHCHPLEKEMATHSNTFAWEISWTGKPGGLQSIGLQKS